MSFFLHDSMSEFEAAEFPIETRRKPSNSNTSARQRCRIIEGKLRVPDSGVAVERDRLNELLDRSINNYGATLISGRAGTGKTTLAAQYANRQENACWYSIEPADAEWREFSSCFAACLFPRGRKPRPSNGQEPSDAEISDFITGIFVRLAKQSRPEPRLIVLDNVQYLFDAGWFGSFFKQLITSLNNGVRLLMLCRSKPSAPLWRLRSKQMLNVIDENMLDLTVDEAAELAKVHGANLTATAEALKSSYGRVCAFLKDLESARIRLSRK